MKFFELLQRNEYHGEVNTDVEISEISSDSKSISENTLFALINGEKQRDNGSIDCILSKKPKIILTDENFHIKNTDIPQISVKSVRKILPLIYSRFYKINYEAMRFFGITGTNGKTTTATLLYNVFLSAGYKTGFIGTGKILIGGRRITDNNYSMTTPDPDLLYRSIKRMENENCKVVVMEVSSHSLYFDKVSAIPFEVSGFTNLSPEHLDFHKNMREYLKNKLKLFEISKIGIFNTDNEYLKEAFEGVKCTVKKTVGITSMANLTANNVKLDGFLGSSFTATENGKELKIASSLSGRHNVYNSLMAIAMARCAKISDEDIREGVESVATVDGRFEVISKDPYVIIDYAHTEEAMRNTLSFINSIKNPRQKTITVFGCGGERDKAKRSEMGRTAEFFSDFVIVTADNSRGEPTKNIIEDILKGFTKTDARIVISNRRVAIEYAVSLADKNDVVAILGKGHEKYNIDNEGYHPFDEKAIVKNAIKEKRERINDTDTEKNFDTE